MATAPPGRTRDPARDRRILAAAAQLFYERGFGDVGVDEIGERAGITGPAIYRHFASKEEILSTLFDEALDTVFAEARLSADDPWQELHHLALKLAEFAVREHRLASVLFREERSLTGAFRRRLERREGDYIAIWIDCVARGLGDQNPERVEMIAKAGVGLVSTAARWRIEEFRRPGVPDLLAAMVVSAVRGEAAQHPLA